MAGLPVWKRPFSYDAGPHSVVGAGEWLRLNATAWFHLTLRSNALLICRSHALKRGHRILQLQGWSCPNLTQLRTGSQCFQPLPTCESKRLLIGFDHLLPDSDQPISLFTRRQSMNTQDRPPLSLWKLSARGCLRFPLSLLLCMSLAMGAGSSTWLLAQSGTGDAHGYRGRLFRRCHRERGCHG